MWETTGDWLFSLKEALLLIMDSCFSRKQCFKVKSILKINLFHLLSSPDVNWWTVWIIVMFLSDSHSDGTHSSIDETLMQRHISTNLMKKQTHPDLGWAEGWAHSQHIFLFGWTIHFNMEIKKIVWTLWPVLTIFSVQYKLNIIDSICDMLLITKNRNKQTSCWK